MLLDPCSKAADQRRAAAEAVDLLEVRLGEEFLRFVELFDVATFRFAAAMRERAWRRSEQAFAPPTTGEVA